MMPSSCSTIPAMAAGTAKASKLQVERTGVEADRRAARRGDRKVTRVLCQDNGDRQGIVKTNRGGPDILPRHSHPTRCIYSCCTPGELLTTNSTAAAASTRKACPDNWRPLPPLENHRKQTSEVLRPHLAMSQLVKVASPATPTAPATPASQKAQDLTPAGAWKHPKFDEIARRQYATTFDERNVKIILANAALLLLSSVASSVTTQVALLRALAYVFPSLAWRMWLLDKANEHVRKPLVALIHTVPYNEWITLTIRLVLLANIVVALLPLARRYYPDDLADIPLTPSQRQVMGLKPGDGTPQTPGSAYASPNYVTPPRYQKSTPRSSFGTPGERGSQSPLSGSPRASMAKSTSNSPFSPSTGSPLFQKAIGGGSATKRLSYGGSPLSSSFFGDSSSSATPGTPTPVQGKASVGLNNKWLYEKRRDSPRSSLFN